MTAKPGLTADIKVSYSGLYIQVSCSTTYKRHRAMGFLARILHRAFDIEEMPEPAPPRFSLTYRRLMPARQSLLLSCPLLSPDSWFCREMALLTTVFCLPMLRYFFGLAALSGKHLRVRNRSKLCSPPAMSHSRSVNCTYPSFQEEIHDRLASQSA